MGTARVFTPAEANKTLVLVRRIVRDILAKAAEARKLMQSGAANTHAMEEQIDRLRDEVRGHMRELTQLGCFYKDWNFDIGLVDFPAIIDGKPVLLCWRSDEDELAWYHSEDGGFAGRRPIPAELLES